MILSQGDLLIQSDGIMTPRPGTVKRFLMPIMKKIRNMQQIIFMNLARTAIT